MRAARRPRYDGRLPGPQHRARWAIAHALASACGNGAFACEDDDACEGAGQGGLCEPTGFCSLPDDACASGRRYGEYAGDGLAGQCVDLGGTTGDVGTSGPAITLDGSLDGTLSTSTTVDPASTSIDPATSTDGDASSSTGEGVCPPAWWDCAWSHRVPISLGPTTIPPAGVVPVLVRLDGERWDPTTARADALDLRFVDPLGNELAYEIEQTGEPTIVWLSWPSLDDLSAPVTMYWGNADAGDVQAPSEVWDDAHLAVWHLADAHDSTGTIDLVDFGTMATPGAVGGARAFDGEAAHLRAPEGSAIGELLLGDATIEAFIHPLSFGQQGRGRIIDCASDDEPTSGWTLRVRDIDPEGSGLQLERANVGVETGWTAGGTVAPGTWIHVAMVWTDGDAQMFVDGEGVETQRWEGSGPPIDLASCRVAIGRVAETPSGAFDGWIDEVRVSSVARDPSWLAWQHRSAVDTALVYGDAESWR